MRKLIVTAVVLLSFVAANAQCAMCKATLESNESDVGVGINSGILFLMAIPYLAMAGAGFFIYRHYKKQRSL